MIFLQRNSYMKILLTIFVLFFSSSVLAETINLKCKVNETNSSINAKVNIDEGFMEFGWIKYDITSVTDEYITGFQTEDVGGDIWVLNRIDGNYLRSFNWITCVDNNCEKKRELDAGIFSGNCNKKLL